MTTAECFAGQHHLCPPPFRDGCACRCHETSDLGGVLSCSPGPSATRCCEPGVEPLAPPSETSRREASGQNKYPLPRRVMETRCLISCGVSTSVEPAGEGAQTTAPRQVPPTSPYRTTVRYCERPARVRVNAPGPGLASRPCLRRRPAVTQAIPAETTRFRKRPIPVAVRREVALANGGVPGQWTQASCAYCGSPGGIHWPTVRGGRPGAWVTFWRLELDHVVPEFHGGVSTAENLVLACRPCNRRKGHRVGAAHA